MSSNALSPNEGLSLHSMTSLPLRTLDARRASLIARLEMIPDRLKIKPNRMS